MLKHLSITNYALIDRLELELDAGLTIVTGETGAGKSIIMGALALLLGERADAKMVTDAGRKTVVEATFDVEGYNLAALMAEGDIEHDERECILRREVSANGRSRAFVNDTPVQLTFIRSLATRLVDIHSQHSNMLLSQPAYQLHVLDSLADNAGLIGEYADAYREYCARRHALDQLRASVAAARSEQDYLRFQLAQLETLDLKPGEAAELEAAHDRLANVEQLKEQLWEATSLLDGDGHSMLADLQTVASRLDAAAERLPEIADAGDRVRSAIIDLKDIAATASQLQDTLVHDPAELQRVEDRLAAIYSLQRRHNVADPDELVALRESLCARLQSIDHSDEQTAALEAEIFASRDALLIKATTLSCRRMRAAEALRDEMERQAATLAMPHLRFVIDFTTSDEPGPVGVDSVEFRFAFNKNQTPMPVGATASGGEISRVMLCVKTIVARSMQLPTIIFDEVDTGVSGDVAARIGEMMHDIAGHIQVLAITHLPQVAARGDHHWRVFKSDTEQGTVTAVETLDDEGHVLEVARMLAGHDVDAAAVANARSLINSKLDSK
ncbi:MAG: DNA repair protein RecN [Muribaculaceae bacterium]|nr:DNA repair protein RecN [Muribaculaceae bacterium]